MNPSTQPPTYTASLMYATLTSLLGHASLCLESLCWSGLTVHSYNITSFILLYKASLLSYRISMLGLHRKYTKLALFFGPMPLKGQQSMQICFTQDLCLYETQIQ